MPENVLLEMRGMVKTFPGVRALDRVDFRLERGQIQALMGQNGAGKSTLIKVLTGVYRADAGEIVFDGEPFQAASPFDAQRSGISTLFQEINLVPQLSVAENLMLGREPRRCGLIRWRRLHQAAEKALARLEVPAEVDRPVGSYSTAVQQMVAIARAVDFDARVLVLDEPTSSLDAAEVEQLFIFLRRLRSAGLGILFVTHFLDQVYEVADRITVLRNGGLVGDYGVAELPRQELVARMLGQEVPTQRLHPGAAEQLATDRTEAPPLLEAKQLGRKGAVERVDLSVGRRQVIGLAGLLGSGRTETARLLFGIDRSDAGSLSIDGDETRMRTPREAIRHGLGFCSEDRKAEGLLPELSVMENLLIALQATRGWLRRLSSRRQRELAEPFVKALDIAVADLDMPVDQLSGGNQQKVLLARWLATHPRLLLLDEPTRGIDVIARAEIEALIAKLSAEGMSVLFISSDLEEVARISDEVVVLRDRCSVAHLRQGEVELDAILRSV